ncbi:hypothetical protein PG984_015794 [Apiospora sp. TS-2023a]
MEGTPRPAQPPPLRSLIESFQCLGRFATNNSTSSKIRLAASLLRAAAAAKPALTSLPSDVLPTFAASLSQSVRKLDPGKSSPPVAEGCHGDPKPTPPDGPEISR